MVLLRLRVGISFWLMHGVWLFSKWPWKPFSNPINREETFWWIIMVDRCRTNLSSSKLCMDDNMMKAVRSCWSDPKIPIDIGDYSWVLEEVFWILSIYFNKYNQSLYHYVHRVVGLSENWEVLHHEQKEGICGEFMNLRKFSFLSTLITILFNVSFDFI